jgi:hypothetical protein
MNNLDIDPNDIDPVPLGSIAVGPEELQNTKISCPEIVY